MTSRTRDRRHLSMRPPHRKVPTRKRPLEHPFIRVWREVAHGEWRRVHLEDPKSAGVA